MKYTIASITLLALNAAWASSTDGDELARFQKSGAVFKTYTWSIETGGLHGNMYYKGLDGKIYSAKIPGHQLIFVDKKTEARGEIALQNQRDQARFLAYYYADTFAWHERCAISHTYAPLMKLINAQTKASEIITLPDHKDREKFVSLLQAVQKGIDEKKPDDAQHFVITQMINANTATNGTSTSSSSSHE